MNDAEKLDNFALFQHSLQHLDFKKMEKVNIKELGTYFQQEFNKMIDKCLNLKIPKD